MVSVSALKGKGILALVVVCLPILSLLISGCSDRMPSEDDFSTWLMAIYHKETGLTANHIKVYLWERTSKNVTRLAPNVDGLRVEAAILSTVPGGTTRGDSTQTILHYVLCRYFVITDEWYLHASSWGGGFWKQEPAEWGHLVQECKDRAETLRNREGLNR